MRLPKLKLLPATLALLLPALAAGCGEANVDLFLEFADPNPPGESQIRPLMITTSTSTTGVVEIAASAGTDFAGTEVQFIATVDGTRIENVTFFGTDPSMMGATPLTNDELALAAGQTKSIWVEIDPMDGATTALVPTEVRVLIRPSVPAGPVENFLSIWVELNAP